MTNTQIKSLIALLDDEDPEIFEHISEKIYSLGEAVITELEEEWTQTPNKVVQERIENIIHRIQQEKVNIGFQEWKKEGATDLLHGMWLVSCLQYPSTSLQEIRKAVDALYYEVWIEFKQYANPYAQIKLINAILFDRLKFRPNIKDFHAIDNSIIQYILSMRKSNPVGLCVIYMLVAQKFNIPVYGVNLPNLFVLTYKDAETQFYINAFSKGVFFSRNDIDKYLEHHQIEMNPAYYEPCSNIEIIKRVLQNLMIAYEKQGMENKIIDAHKIYELLNGE